MKSTPDFRASPSPQATDKQKNAPNPFKPDSTRVVAVQIVLIFIGVALIFAIPAIIIYVWKLIQKRRMNRMAANQSSSTRSTVEWNNDTTNAFIDVCMQHLSSRAHNVGGWYQVIAQAFNERTGLDYNAGQMKNKFDNMKRDWTPWNRLLQFGGGGWDEQLDTVTGTDDWWATVPIPMHKFKSGSPTRFRELDSMFAGCMRTDRCQYAIPDAPPVHLQEAQHFGEIIRGDNAEISSHPTRRQVRSGAGPSRSAPSRMDRGELIDLCMSVRREDDDYQDWEVAVILSTHDRLGHNPFYSLLDKPAQLRGCVIHFVRKLRAGQM